LQKIAGKSRGHHGGRTRDRPVNPTRFRKKGARVCIIDCDHKAGEAVAQELTGNDPAIMPIFFHSDLARPEDIRLAASEIERTVGRVDILVNNAGIEGEKPLAEISGECCDRMIAINLKAPLFLTQAILPLFLLREAASSISALYIRPTRPPIRPLMHVRRPVW
jgi:NAD(P)-dependent dehydrogenase (short-subunit alcohol dehydrogenase family)